MIMKYLVLLILVTAIALTNHAAYAGMSTVLAAANQVKQDVIVSIQQQYQAQIVSITPASPGTAKVRILTNQGKVMTVTVDTNTQEIIHVRQ